MRYGGTAVRTFITVRKGMVVIKLNSGYNIGIPPESCTFIGRPEAEPVKRTVLVQNKDLPELSIISTGGTIASRIDYRTGSVTSQSDAAAILQSIPELAGIGNYTTKSLYTILSENMTPTIWKELAGAVYEEIKRGVAGVIVTHGTDTMAYSAAALVFMIDTPVLIVLSSSDHPTGRQATMR